MIAAIIFAMHAILAVVMFLRGKRTSTEEAVLGLSLVVLIFAIGWTLATFLVGLVWPERGIGLLIDNWGDTPTKRFLYREITMDSMSLVLLSVGEAVFYRGYLGRKMEKEEKNRRGDEANR
ncbi:MAG TPA: hypothetical protein DCX46_02990 [Bacteroidetes bacterium]|nr:hypothetical protein [Bacteroidota bacterium]